MRRFAAPHLDGEVELDATASHHLLSVLRLQPGARIELFCDGRAATARFDRVERQRVVAVVETEPREARPAVALHLVIGMPKGPAMDLAVRMATEAGATHVHPVLAARTVATGDRSARWTRIATSAAQQCGRADVPHVLPPAPLADVLDRLDGVALHIALPGTPIGSPSEVEAAVLVGPEGGWTAAEVDRAMAAGAQPIGLGQWILRTDTATAVAVALLAGGVRTDTGD